MAPARRRDVISSRRRRTDDEGEEEGSQAGEVEDESLSEGSVSSNDDVDAGASDFSDDESIKPDAVLSKNGTSTTKTEAVSIPVPTASIPPEVSSEDIKSMTNGLPVNPNTEKTPELHFDEATPEANITNDVPTKFKPNGTSPISPAEKNRREHEAYLKERKDNPAFVPTRGGFFLHDNRANPSVNGFRPPMRGRGRGRGGQFGAAPYGRPPPEPVSFQWTHDLHETVAQPNATFNSNSHLPAKPPLANSNVPQSQQRSFSTTVVLGNVPVVVFIAGMKERKSVANIQKKQYTLLPNHRPPLRRDKPVRVSIPDASPRYIFPAIERSFIFIPRALRPNQQAIRGRGRGSFHGSRRTSVYGSSYAPSVAMSRRSSMGRGFDDLRSPGGSVLPRGSVVQLPEMSKPVVRLPPSAQSAATGGVIPQVNGPPPPASVLMPPPPYIPNQPLGMHARVIPMHQPSPRKTVSVADIEAPGGFNFNPPLQQVEQPFHQQVPSQVNGNVYGEDQSNFLPHSRHPSHPSQPSGTPLSQIPEAAIHAQPFQPYPMAPPGYMPAPYTTGAVYYTGPNGELPHFNPASAAPFVPQQPAMPYMVPGTQPPAPPHQQGDPSTGQTVAHESNGMVYYYDSSQLQSAPAYGYPMAPAGGVIGMGGMMTPPGGYYYSPAPNGLYYAPQ